jgi:hypothetical protein
LQVAPGSQLGRAVNKLVVVAALILTASPVLAQPGASPVLAPMAGAPMAGEPMAGEPMEAKSEQAAFGLSLLGTVAPFVVTVAAASTDQPELALAGAIGMLVGPSLGHWYAGRYATGGLLMRGAGVALVLGGLVQALDDLGCDGSCGGSDGETLAIAGAAVFVGGTLYDLATAGRAAREWNERHLDMGPTVVSSASGPVPGLGVAGSF